MNATDTLHGNHAQGSPRTKAKLGIGWRPQLALAIERRPDLDFIELMAEDFCPSHELPEPVRNLIQRGMNVAVHSTALSLGGAELPRQSVVERLAWLAERTNAFVVSDHIAFVRSENRESGHLLPVERSDEMIEIIAENIESIKSKFNVPLALENIAVLIQWPGSNLDEASFLRRLLQQTETKLLLDVSNLYANSVNHKFDAEAYLAALPLDRIAYIHLAGGRIRDGVYHDTHTGAVPSGALRLLEQLARMTKLERVMIEIDDDFPGEAELNRQLDEISEVLNK